MLLVAFTTLICIFPSNILFFKWTANFAFHLMLLYFFSGLLFLLLRQARLTFTTFGACAVLCLFLKQASNTDFSPPTPTNAPSLKIAHFNLSNSDKDPQVTIQSIKNTAADLVSIQEITPFWDSLLLDELQAIYPHRYMTHDVHVFGLAIYAQQPFLSIDTFSYQGIPNVIGEIALAGSSKTVHFIGSLTMPPASYKGYKHLTQHLNKVGKYCNHIGGPLLTFGDYNAVPWSDEIQDFREQTQLLDSRRGFMPTYPDGALNFFWTPIDHIFFSPHFKCLSFGTISGQTSKHLGIEGVFQLHQ